jgi:hypothetical protein
VVGGSTLYTMCYAVKTEHTVARILITAGGHFEFGF